MDEPASHAPADDDPLGRLCSLDDPTRRRLYEHVAAAGEPLTRDEAAAAVGIDRSLAAYHLDRLADEGLLDVSFARPEGKGGPGAGRPAKHYTRAPAEFSVAVPPRDYRLAAELLARAAESDPTGAVREALQQAATALGREVAEQAATALGRAELAGSADLLEQLRHQGFEPYIDGAAIRLRNCPFHRLAAEHTELVCGMNLALLTGVVEALDADARPRLAPDPGHCCVVLDTD